MATSVLLDTNTAIQVLNRKVDLALFRSRGAEIYLCLTVIGELYFGAERSGRPEENRERVRRLVEACPVLPTSLETSRTYGALKARLFARGKPIPENDYWIASIALQYGLALATNDGHFDEVEELEKLRT